MNYSFKDSCCPLSNSNMQLAKHNNKRFQPNHVALESTIIQSWGSWGCQLKWRIIKTHALMQSCIICIEKRRQLGLLLTSLLQDNTERICCHGSQLYRWHVYVYRMDKKMKEKWMPGRSYFRPTEQLCIICLCSNEMPTHNNTFVFLFLSSIVFIFWGASGLWDALHCYSGHCIYLM